MLEGQEGISHPALGQHPWMLRPPHAPTAPRQAPRGQNSPRRQVLLGFGHHPILGPPLPALSLHDPPRGPQGNAGGSGLGLSFARSGFAGRETPRGWQCLAVWHRWPQCSNLPGFSLKSEGRRTPASRALARKSPREAGRAQIRILGIPAPLSAGGRGRMLQGCGVEGHCPHSVPWDHRGMRGRAGQGGPGCFSSGEGGGPSAEGSLVPQQPLSALRLWQHGQPGSLALVSLSPAQGCSRKGLHSPQTHKPPPAA